MPPNSQLAVIGGGPADLRAAEVAASAGLQVTLFEVNGDKDHGTGLLSSAFCHRVPVAQPSGKEGARAFGG